MSATETNAAETETNVQTKTIKIEPSETEAAGRLADQKSMALRNLGMRFMAALEAATQVNNMTGQEQQFLNSIATKYELPDNTRMRFLKDGTLEATFVGDPSGESA